MQDAAVKKSHYWPFDILDQFYCQEKSSWADTLRAEGELYREFDLELGDATDQKSWNDAGVEVTQDIVV